MSRLMTATRRLLVLVLAAFAAALASLAIPSAAEAGTYSVWECAGTGGGPAAGPDVQGPFGGATYSTFNRCSESSSDYGISNFASNGAGAYQAFDVFAPPGTLFTSGYAEVNISNGGNNQGYVSIGNGSVLTGHISTGTSGWQGINWSGHGNTTQFTVWLQCSVVCTSASSWSWARNLIFNVNDQAAPTVSLGGSLAAGGWFNDSGTLDVSGSDSGGGAWHFDTYVNGQHLHRGTAGCSEATLFGGPVGTRLTPCPTSNSTSISRNVNSGPFTQGANTFTGCVADFSTAGNSNEACRSTTVNVDTIAPESPSALGVAGGEAWRSTNEFDISWSNPAQPHAPIGGAAYRITKVGGGYDSGRQFVSGSDRDSLSDMTLPSSGEYQIKVWLRDAALNESEANARTATLRLDPTVPLEVEARDDGWIRRNDFEYTARWEQLAASQVGPSGLAGYSVRVTQDPSTDPCVTGADPAASCSPGEVNNEGIGDTEMPVPAAEVSDGQWYIHVVPVTGAGVKAAAVSHTPMPVDGGDPQSSISALPAEWVNHDVTVSVSASDELSGMSASPGHSMDPQPRTCIEVGQAEADCQPGDSLTRVIASEGQHTLRYFARDLAGNVNDGRPDAEYPGKLNNPPRTALVRIDKSPPALDFAVARSTDDPSQISVSAKDALSGLAGGTIELRRQGSNQGWTALETTATADGFRGYVPDDVEPGRYEFRASATDRAGNAGATSTRADGSPMVEHLPLKEAVNLTAIVARGEQEPAKGGGRCRKVSRGKGKGNGKCKRPPAAIGVPYGQQVRLSGFLQTSDDAPLRGRELTVIERMAEGGAPRERLGSVETDQGGAYSIDLAPGPSRSVVVRYAGEQRYRSAAAEVDVAVRPKLLSFRASKRVPETESIRFRGRVGMAGVDLRSQGKRIELQYEKSKRNWRTIDSADAGADGRFKLRYALRSNYIRPTGVRFRALVPPERAWPYVGAAVSKPRRTVILP